MWVLCQLAKKSSFTFQFKDMGLKTTALLCWFKLNRFNAIKNKIRYERKPMALTKVG